MQELLFMGDEVTAAGFRLVGVETRVIAAGEDAATVVAGEIGQRRILLLTTALGRALPKPMYERLLQSVEPVVVFLPDLRGHEGPLDLGARVRRELGIEG